MIELLAPAGNLERLKIAFLYGADAVYIGGYEYSLRANAINFSKEELKEAVLFAHQYQRKVYVTVNIVFHNRDLDGLKNYLWELALIKVDAVIVSDIAVITMIREEKIPLEIHLSTQASTLNYEAALFYKNLGVKRIVLAREACRKDILDIKEKTGLDLECFIQGAMCTSFSGKCVLSNVATNRDSNRGGCAQICRWIFKINEEEKPFSMTPKDLNMSIYLKDMMDIGITSFKIEGRMRSIYYVSTVLLSYRRMIDAALNNTLTKEKEEYYLKILNRCANRESTPQFYDKLPGVNEEYWNGRTEVSNQDFLGLVMDYDEEEKVATIEVRNYFGSGQVVQFFGPNHETFDYLINTIYDNEGNIIEVCRHPKSIIKLKVDNKLQINDMMRLKVFDKLEVL